MLKKKECYVCSMMLLILFVFSSHCAKNSDILKVGIIAPLSGNAGVYGKSLLEGIQIAEEDYLKSAQRPMLKLFVEDSKAEPREAVSAINKLMNINNVDCIIGDMFTSTTLAIAPIAHKANMLLVSPTASAQEISQIGSTIFRLYPSEIEEGTALAGFYLQTFQGKNAGIITLNEDAMIKVTQTIQANIDHSKMIYSDIYSKGLSDYRALVMKIPSNIEVLFVIGYMNDVSLIVRQARQLNRDFIFMGLSTLYDPKFIELSGTAANGVYFSAPFFDLESSDAAIKNFREKFRKKYDKEPDVWAGYGFDTANIVIKVLKESRENKQQPWMILSSLKDYEGVTGKTSITSDRGVKKQFKILEVKNNMFIDKATIL